MILEWEANGQRQSLWLTPNTPAMIGRGTDCAVVLAHPTVSRQHAEVVSAGADVYVRNVSQRNPVIIEYPGSTVRLDWGQQGTIYAGTRLRLGEMEVFLRAPVALRVRCPGPCGRVVEVPASGFCPHCGTALATAETYTG